MTLGRQDALTAQAQELAAANPAVVAGASLQYAPSERLVVAATSDISLSGVPADLRPYITVRRVTYPPAVLAGVQDAVVRALSRAGTNAETYQNTAEDQVVVDLPTGPVPSEVSQVIAAQPAGSVRTTSGYTRPTQASTSCDQWTCPAPMRGGVEIDSPIPSQPNYYTLCSTAFMAKSRSSGNNVVLSAGHCTTSQASDGTWTSPGPNDTIGAGPTVGKTQNFANGGNYDGSVMNLNVTGGAYNQFNEPWVYDRSTHSVSPDTGPTGYTIAADDAYTITGVASSGQYVNNAYLCKAGRTTGKTCGVINKLNVTSTACENGTNNCTTYTGFFGAGLCSNGGDSGGGMYSVNSYDTGGAAYGIVSFTNTYSSCSTSSETYSATMPNLLAALGVTITTGVAPTSRTNGTIV